MGSTHSKISITAQLVAYYRQFSDIPFARQVAEYVGAERAFHGLVSEHDLDSDELRIYAPILEARYRSIEALIRASQVTQVLELASGFSLRGLAMTGDPTLHYVESDLPGLNDDKQPLVRRLRSERGLVDHGNHWIVAADALVLAELREATTTLRRGAGLLVVTEGLLPYFSAAERRQVAENVRELLSDFGGGAWITPDFTLRAESQAVSEKRRVFREAVRGVTERRLHDAAFADTDALNAFLADVGFEVTTRDQFGELTGLTAPAGVAPKVWILRPR